MLVHSPPPPLYSVGTLLAHTYFTCPTYTYRTVLQTCRGRASLMRIREVHDATGAHTLIIIYPRAWPAPYTLYAL
jgi:hypothetical protein